MVKERINELKTELSKYGDVINVSTLITDIKNDEQKPYREEWEIENKKYMVVVYCCSYYCIAIDSVLSGYKINEIVIRLNEGVTN